MTKLIRSAFWSGTPKQGQESTFRAAIDNELVPNLGRLPGVSAARALWPEQGEDNPPEIYCQVIVEFADEAAKAQMMGSPERQQMRARVGEVAAMFDGHLSHIDYIVGSAQVQEKA